jgi:serine/threonine-protein kinase
MLAVCAGVHAAHGKGIVHRDLKPGNIFLCPDWQGRETARVLDFGISKVGGVSGSGLTETGDIVGTSQYLSPEQAAGARHVNEASDQYSLGVVMYECVTGQTPQRGLPIHELLRNVTHGHHVAARELRPDLSAELEAVIERAMSVRPKDRFPSVHELGRALFPFATPEVKRRFDDYYRSDPDMKWPTNSRWRSQPEPRPEPAPTLRQPDEPLATWQARPTRTSASHPRRTPSAKAAVTLPARGIGLGAEGSGAQPAGAHPLYSVAVGAVLAALALGILLLVLRP